MCQVLMSTVHLLCACHAADLGGGVMQQRCKCVCSCPMAASSWVGSAPTTVSLHSTCVWLCYCRCVHCCCGAGLLLLQQVGCHCKSAHRHLQTGQILWGGGCSFSYLLCGALNCSGLAAENAGPSDPPPQAVSSSTSGRSWKERSRG